MQTHTHTYIYVYVYIYVYICIYICIYMYIYVYICIYMYIYIYTFRHTHTHVYIYIYTITYERNACVYNVWIDTCIISIELRQGRQLSLMSPFGRRSSEVQRGRCLDVGAGNLSNLLPGMVRSEKKVSTSQYWMNYPLARGGFPRNNTTYSLVI